VVQIHADQSTTLLPRYLDFPFYVPGFCVSVIANQENVCIGELNFLAAALLDIPLVAGVDRVVKLEVGEVEIDVLVRLPGTHHPVAVDVSATEAYEGTRKRHISLILALNLPLVERPTTSTTNLQRLNDRRVGQSQHPGSTAGHLPPA
jgi:hypothetical protein